MIYWTPTVSNTVPVAEPRKEKLLGWFALFGLRQCFWAEGRMVESVFIDEKWREKETGFGEGGGCAIEEDRSGAG